MVKNETLELSPGIPLELILVQPGYFIMGDVNGYNFTGETHEHLVQITQPFYIGKYPVTQAQWQAVMQEGHLFDSPGARRPVEQVSYTDIMGGNQNVNGAPTFLTRLNAILSEKRPDLFATQEFTLPTEAQWEYAAKGGPRYTHKELKDKQAAQLYAAYAGSDRLESCGWSDDNSHNETKPVGLKAPNELGLYDMSGNVWEWCRDVMDRGVYAKRKKSEVLAEDPVNLEGGVERVVRGGSSWNYARYCRVAHRNYGHHPTSRGGGIGFRVVLSPSSGSGAAG
jgi:formylglycine-generating enzyme required for sulfatase activity